MADWTRKDPSVEGDKCFRKIATVRTIENLTPIQGADNIETALIDGWNVVVKKGEFKIGAACVYCEIDSWIPTNIAPFLSKGKSPKEYNNVKGERLKTVQLRGQISQGLVLPVSVLGNEQTQWTIGQDVTENLGIQKYDPCEINCGKKNVFFFPPFFPKTDQERIQNLKRYLDVWKSKQLTWEVTEKLDGASMTMYFRNEVFGVCSRNLDLKEDPEEVMWQVARQTNLEEKMKNLNRNLAIQGELIGEKIAKNRYAVKGKEFHMFDIYDIDKRQYLKAGERRELAEKLELKHCPVIEFYRFSNNESVQTLLDMAEGKSALNNATEREGLVFKCLEENLSFKVISNKFLLKGGN